jgi:DNA-directed RNA polymerase subunit RPC12/RpoP
MSKAYCVKCKKEVTMKDPKKKVNKRGLEYMQGNCPNCNIKVNRITGKKSS